MTSLVLGPFAVPLARVFLLLGLAVVFVAAIWPSRRLGRDLERPLLLAMVLGLVAARIAYVATHLADFGAQPWQALFLWQDGYVPLAGVAVAGTVAWLASRRGRYPARYVLGPLAAGVLTWGALTGLSERFLETQTQRLPQATLQDLDGKNVPLQAFAGRPVVVNVWATWCPPCRREMPVLGQAQRGERTVHFVFLNQREAAPAVKRYLAAQGLALDNVLLDAEGTVSAQLGVRALPTTLFFDSEGRLADAHVGELTRARLRDYLESLQAGD